MKEETNKKIEDFMKRFEKESEKWIANSIQIRVL
jgi:hypothetical protein